MDRLRHSPLLKNLSQHQIVDLGFAGRVWCLEKNTVVVRQGRLVRQSDMSHSSSSDGFVYITLKGSFSLRSEVSAGGPERLDLDRYLANIKTSKEVPLMMD